MVRKAAGPVVVPFVKAVPIVAPPFIGVPNRSACLGSFGTIRVLVSFQNDQ